MDNIFTALVRRRTTGVVMEFVLWCIVCFAALLSLIALAMGAGNFVWILLLLTAAGLGVIMAFRLKEVALLYSVCVFNAILMLGFYGLFAFFYWDLGNQKEIFSLSLKIAFSFPLISLILDYLAIRNIGADEALVRSLDRLR